MGSRLEGLNNKGEDYLNTVYIIGLLAIAWAAFWTLYLLIAVGYTLYNKITNNR